MHFAAEARPLIEELKLEKKPSFEPIIPLEFFSGKYGGMEVFVVTNGKCSRFGVDNVCSLCLPSGPRLTLFSARSGPPPRPWSAKQPYPTSIRI